MLGWLAQWPYGMTETIAVIAFLVSGGGFVVRLIYRVLAKLEDLAENVGQVSQSGIERGDEHARQMSDLNKRVTSVEGKLTAREASENSIIAGQRRIEDQQTALAGRMDNLLHLLIQRKE